MAPDIVHHAISISNIQEGSLPIKYLGLPLITSRLTKADCEPLLLRICEKIESWTTRALRFSGRLQLVKSILFNIQGYWYTYIFLPKNVLKKLQTVLARFLWGGKLDIKCHHKVAWSTCCALKEEGGLSIRDLFEWNQSAILFQIWRISQPSSTSLWINWIKMCLLHGKHFWTTAIPYACPWNVRKILNSRHLAVHHLQYEIGEQSLFSLWHDPWLAFIPLITRYGRSTIFSMDSSPHALVQSIIHEGAWRPSPSNDISARSIRQSILATRIHTSDAVLWDGSKHVNISVIWDSIRRRCTPPAWTSAVWHQLAIPKCAFFMWLALHSSLLTRDKLIDYGYTVNPICPMCNSADESCIHLFSSCPVTYIILRECPVSVNIRWSDWQNGQFLSNTSCNIERLVGHLYISAVIYIVWMERNARVHNSSQPKSYKQLIYLVKNMVRERLFNCKLFQKQLRKSPQLIHLLY